MRDGGRREELRSFLRERRARLRPEQVGLPSGKRRRVPGLRREEVASLAGIGVSWYTQLENGDLDVVSEATLTAVADALRLNESERDYLTVLAGLPSPAGRPEAPIALVLPTLEAITFPAYLINAMWQISACNSAFRQVWQIEDPTPFGAVDRLFLDERSRKLHGERFEENITPVIAMVQSSVGRYPDALPLRDLRERILADAELRKIWDAHEISSPMLANKCTIDAAGELFTYQTLTLLVSNTLALVIQVPDEESQSTTT